MEPLFRYLIKRFIAYIVTLFLAISFAFFLFRLLPGDPINAFIVSMIQSQYIQGVELMRTLDMYVEAFNLDKDPWTQYVSFWKELILRGNLGPSFIEFPKPAIEIILWRIPWTLGLLGTSVIISWILGSTLGALIGWRHNSKLDGVFSTIALVLGPIPYYIIAIMVILTIFFLGGTIAYGAYDPRLTPGFNLPFIISVIQRAIPPALSLILVSASMWLISMRSLMISTLGEDYLLLAEAKGLRKARIFYKYAFRNSILPQVTSLAISLGFVMSGSILVENLFNYPGIGYLFFMSLQYLDYNTIMGCLILIMFSVLTATLLLDVLLPFLDPRIVYEA